MQQADQIGEAHEFDGNGRENLVGKWESDLSERGNSLSFRGDQFGAKELNAICDGGC